MIQIQIEAIITVTLDKKDGKNLANLVKPLIKPAKAKKPKVVKIKSKKKISDLLTVDELKKEYPSGYCKFRNRYTSFKDDQDADNHARASGWLFNQVGELIEQIPDDEISWTVHELKRWSPRGYKMAWKDSKLSTYAEFDTLASKSDWRFMPNGERQIEPQKLLTKRGSKSKKQEQHAVSKSVEEELDNAIAALRK